mmetsp:Transcript_7116/g.14604  ORF Transcript_7116/g.14604 Transcript_7116/m.14604 type:complete len:212 (-) Transcript_7116:292-927(-)
MGPNARRVRPRRIGLYQGRKNQYRQKGQASDQRTCCRRGGRKSKSPSIITIETGRPHNKCPATQLLAPSNDSQNSCHASLFTKSSNWIHQAMGDRQPYGKLAGREGLPVSSSSQGSLNVNHSQQFALCQTGGSHRICNEQTTSFDRRGWCVRVINKWQEANLWRCCFAIRPASFGGHQNHNCKSGSATNGGRGQQKESKICTRSAIAIGHF